MNTKTVREQIIEYLERELVGPTPGFPAMQLNHEEILRPQDPPRLRYSAGMLFPMKTTVQVQLDTSEDTIEDIVAAPPEEGDVLDAGQVEQAQSTRTDTRSDQQPETDGELSLANEYLPSAMGISALVDIPSKLCITVNAAQYKKEKVPGLGRPSTTIPSAWFRVPFQSEVIFARAELVRAGIVMIEREVLIDNKGVGLSVHIVSRPFAPPGQENTRLLTATLINRNTGASIDALFFFQCELVISDKDSSACFLEYPDYHASADPEDRALQFLYRHKKVFAVGHGCAGEWAGVINGRCHTVKTEILPCYEVKTIEHVELPDLDLSMITLAQRDSEESIQLCEALADQYALWIELQAQRIPDQTEVPAQFRAIAEENISQCRRCLDRIRTGIELLKNRTDVRRAFALANEAMYMQQAHYELASRSVRDWIFENRNLCLAAPFVKPNYQEKNAKWRPFQLAFILMNLESIADEDSQERKIVDLIWFPTGGGKTEAYLGLSAYTIFLRRLRNTNNAGTTVLMRYTLRLLTAQQFQRAASLICACEYLRRSRPHQLGESPISIGLWVGQGVTPNRQEDANRALNELSRGSRENPFIVLSCPWCGAKMGPVKAGTTWRVKGYIKKLNPSRVVFCCEDPNCDFSTPEGLPLHVVDDAIYTETPSLVIGTVDKFAMLPWRPEARSLFGIGRDFDPPALIVQDELHLISGPLGSMVAHYETAIEALCCAQNEHCEPKIVASTATIARAGEQIRSLYNNRSSFLFPPQGLRVGESFFARENEDAPGRCYLGVFASALPSHVTAQIRVVSSLLQAVKSISVSDPNLIDPYWTLVAYFNSIRELGHAATLIRADIREYMNALWDRQGYTAAIGGQEILRLRRFINRDLELTSRIQSNQIPEILQQLFQTLQTGGEEQSAVDICLATNMIQVGLDVPRLSLMTIIGQPKTTAEYIQASSRIGRREPGLVVTIYNPSRPRDRSHYEHFHAYHQSLYRFVEPTSITPFSDPVIERALHAVMVTLIRMLGDESLRSRPNAPPPDESTIERVKSIILDRVSVIDAEQMNAALARFESVVGEWLRVPPPKYGDFGPPDDEEPLMYPSGTDRYPRWSMRPLPTPSSMRNVDSTCDANVISDYPQPD